MSLRVIARFQAKESKVDALKQLLSTLPGPTRGEPGCIRYELLQNTAEPADFTFVEEWESRAALETHLNREHVTRVLDQVGELIEGAGDVRTYHLVR